MATQGSPWICETSKITESLKKNKGRLTYVCKDLGVCYETLKTRINTDEELIKLVSDLRNNFENSLLDLAEGVVNRAMEDQDTDPNNALKSAFFTLNSRGTSRGWSNTLAMVQPLESLAAMKERLEKGEITQPEKPS